MAEPDAILGVLADVEWWWWWSASTKHTKQGDWKSDSVVLCARDHEATESVVAMAVESLRMHGVKVERVPDDALAGSTQIAVHPFARAMLVFTFEGYSREARNLDLHYERAREALGVKRHGGRKAGR
jgi:hypothetical protein